MTGEQTVKGLEICSSEHLGCEDGCPYVEVACLGGDALLKDAFALVKTRDTEIDILIRKNETLKDENFELKAEVEELYKSLDKYILEIHSQKTEIERLKNLESLKKAIYNIAHGIGTNNPCEFATKEARDISYEYAINKLVDIALVRKTAIMEFAERVKPILRAMFDLMIDDDEGKCIIENCKKHSSIPCMNEYCITENREAWEIKIDNLVKELTE